MWTKFIAVVSIVACVPALAQTPAPAADALATDINESIFKLPTTVKGMRGETISGDIVVTQYKPDGNGPFPIALVLHGRSATDRALPARQRYVQAARYLVRRGFAVWVPTRMGYGALGVTPDPEASGACKTKNYGPGADAAATSMLDVLTYAKGQSFVDPTRIVLIGQSAGGLISIALNAKSPAGVKAVVNFAGGNGGNPDLNPEEPCEPKKLEALYGSYGKTARISSLWIYAANDKFFGERYPKSWFSAFEKNGGVGEFVAMPAFGDDGHSLFGKGFPLWRPMLDKFLARQGFAIPASPGEHVASGYALISEAGKVPLISDNGREKYESFLKMDIPRAFAIGPRGAYYYSSAPDAVRRAEDGCQKLAKAPCKLYAVDDNVVWKE